ncbi:MAG: sigma-70 family RNA polymerase sigma factor [Planctomycetes bacterium]|nr:sigma-70 family RNA polymerase sigma factor [Planctomycetota bacterium]
MADTDSQLARRLARGEETAFAELYDACAERLLRYLTMRLASADRAADVLQTAMLRAVKSRRRFAKVDSPAAYLFQIARNEAARLAKRLARRSEQSLTAEQMLELIDKTEDSREDVETILAALARLEEEDRELVQLKIHAGLTFREIAEITGRPQATVATRYRRALDSLRPWLMKQYQE